MDSLVGYGSDDEHEYDRYGGHQASVGGGSRRREDDTNYEEVNMDMSEESEPELPPAERPRDERHRRGSADSRERRGGSRDRRDRDRRRESPRRDRRSPRRDDRNRQERGDRGRADNSRRGLLGDRPDEKTAKPPALMDLKPFGGEAPPGYSRSQDARDAVSPRFVDRERRDKDREPRERERERDRDNRDSRHSRRSEGSEERRSREPRDVRADKHDGRSRSRGAGAAFPPPPAHHGSSSDRRSPSGDYRPSSYKVNRKLEVMEKMGLQIKTPDGSMATAQQLRAAAHDSGAPAPSYFNSQAGGSHRILDQVAKRKLLWAHKNKSEAEEAARWSGTRFAADSDGKQASKFMRLMGIKEPGAIKQDAPEKAVDPIKKQEELFQAMQAQYEVARATTHTMRGVGLGFQRGQY